MMKSWLQKLMKPFKILAVMGNHDNYDLIEKLPEVEMFGAKVLKVSDNVFYLKRGEVYIIEDKRFLVLGGAMSDDKAWRKAHESWWEQEEWSEEEKETCLAKIKENNNFDYVLSHTGPSVGIALTDDYFCNEENLKQLHRDSNAVFNDKIEPRSLPFLLQKLPASRISPAFLIFYMFRINFGQME